MSVRGELTKEKLIGVLCANSEPQLQKVIDQLYLCATKGNQQQIQVAIDTIKEVIKDEKTIKTAKPRYNALLVLKELMKSENEIVVNYFGKKILDRMEAIAKHKPSVKDMKRGETCLDIYLKKNPDPEYSYKFFHLLLESWKHWNEMYGSTKFKGGQQIKKAFDRIKSKKPLFPEKEKFYSEFMYIPNTQRSLGNSNSHQDSSQEIFTHEPSERTLKNETSIQQHSLRETNRTSSSPKKPPRPPSKENLGDKSIDEKNRKVDDDLAKKVSQNANNLTEGIMSYAFEASLDDEQDVKETIGDVYESLKNALNGYPEILEPKSIDEVKIKYNRAILKAWGGFIDKDPKKAISLKRLQIYLKEKKDVTYKADLKKFQSNSPTIKSYADEKKSNRENLIRETPENRKKSYADDNKKVKELEELEDYSSSEEDEPRHKKNSQKNEKKTKEFDNYPKKKSDQKKKFRKESVSSEEDSPVHEEKIELGELPTSINNNKDLMSFNKAVSKNTKKDKKTKSENNFSQSNIDFNLSLEDSSKKNQFDISEKFDFDTISTTPTKQSESLMIPTFSSVDAKMNFDSMETDAVEKVQEKKAKKKSKKKDKKKKQQAEYQDVQENESELLESVFMKPKSQNEIETVPEAPNVPVVQKKRVKSKSIKKSKLKEIIEETEDDRVDYTPAQKNATIKDSNEAFNFDPFKKFETNPQKKSSNFDNFDTNDPKVPSNFDNFEFDSYQRPETTKITVPNTMDTSIGEKVVSNTEHTVELKKGYPQQPILVSEYDTETVPGDINESKGYQKSEKDLATKKPKIELRRSTPKIGIKVPAIKIDPPKVDPENTVDDDKFVTHKIDSPNKSPINSNRNKEEMESDSEGEWDGNKPLKVKKKADEVNDKPADQEEEIDSEENIMDNQDWLMEEDEGLFSKASDGNQSSSGVQKDYLKYSKKSKRTNKNLEDKNSEPKNIRMVESINIPENQQSGTMDDSNRTGNRGKDSGENTEKNQELIIERSTLEEAAERNKPGRKRLRYRGGTNKPEFGEKDKEAPITPNKNNEKLISEKSFNPFDKLRNVNSNEKSQIVCSKQMSEETFKFMISSNFNHQIVTSKSEQEKSSEFPDLKYLQHQREMNKEHSNPKNIDEYLFLKKSKIEESITPGKSSILRNSQNPFENCLGENLAPKQEEKPLENQEKKTEEKPQENLSVEEVKPVFVESEDPELFMKSQIEEQLKNYSDVVHVNQEKINLKGMTQSEEIKEMDNFPTFNEDVSQSRDEIIMDQDPQYSNVGQIVKDDKKVDVEPTHEQSQIKSPEKTIQKNADSDKKNPFFTVADFAQKGLDTDLLETFFGKQDFAKKLNIDLQEKVNQEEPQKNLQGEVSQNNIPTQSKFNRNKESNFENEPPLVQKKILLENEQNFLKENKKDWEKKVENGLTKIELDKLGIQEKIEKQKKKLHIDRQNEYLKKENSMLMKKYDELAEKMKHMIKNKYTQQVVSDTVDLVDQNNNIKQQNTTIDPKTGQLITIKDGVNSFASKDGVNDPNEFNHLNLKLKNTQNEISGLKNMFGNLINELKNMEDSEGSNQGDEDAIVPGDCEEFFGPNDNEEFEMRSRKENYYQDQNGVNQELTPNLRVISKKTDAPDYSIDSRNQNVNNQMLANKNVIIPQDAPIQNMENSNLSGLGLGMAPSLSKVTPGFTANNNISAHTTAIYSNPNITNIAQTNTPTVATTHTYMNVALNRNNQMNLNNRSANHTNPRTQDDTIRVRSANVIHNQEFHPDQQSNIIESPMLNQYTNINRILPNTTELKRHYSHNQQNVTNQPNNRARINSETYNARSDRKLYSNHQNLGRNEPILENTYQPSQIQNEGGLANYISPKAISIHEDSQNVSKRSFQKMQNDNASQNMDYPILPGINLQSYLEKYQKTSQNYFLRSSNVSYPMPQEKQNNTALTVTNISQKVRTQKNEFLSGFNQELDDVLNRINHFENNHTLSQTNQRESLSFFR